MGAGNQKPKVQINIDSLVISAGDAISGRINLSLVKPVNNIRLMLGFSGEERVTYLINDFDWKGNRFEYPHVGNVICKSERLDSGIYSFPFSIRTNECLPGSMNTDDLCHKASISYWVHIDATAEDKFELSHKKEVKIIQKVKSVDKKVKQKNKAKVKYLKVFPRGLSEIRVEMNKRCFSNGDTAGFQIIIDNRLSELGLKNVKITLHRIIRFEYEAGKKAERAHFVHAKKTPIKIPPGESLLSLKAININFPIDLKHRELSGCGSALGNIIKSKYLFEVSASHGTFSTKNKTFLPVLILPEAEKLQNMPTLCEVVEIPNFKKNCS